MFLISTKETQSVSLSFSQLGRPHKFRNSYVVPEAQTHTLLSPVEMQAVAGCPLLPHVDVLPHGSIPAARPQSKQKNQSDILSFGLRR